MAENEPSAKRSPIVIHPANSLLAGFCFVTAIMAGKLADHFVYFGQLSVSSAGIIVLLLLITGAGYLVGIVETDIIEVK